MREFAAFVRFAALLLGFACLPLCGGPVRGNETPGWSDSKPESGPFVEVGGKFMIPYVEKLPGTDISFVMIPVPGGEFLMGSPEDEADRNEDEGPQVRVKVEPFWIGRNEVTWGEYQAYMKMYNAFKQLQSLAQNRDQESSKGGDAKVWELVESHAWEGELEDEIDVDAVTSPTPLYMPDHTYMAGDQPDQPAVTMTQYAARQYTKWLSGITGRQYRLPAEAEWLLSDMSSGITGEILHVDAGYNAMGSPGRMLDRIKAAGPTSS
jgi:sulfatase modifying factor 1